MILFWIFAILSLAGLAICLLQIRAVRACSGAMPPLSPPSSREETGRSLPALFPPVSILKPLKGLDDRLFDNLASFCTLDYPEYEIIFSLQSRNDPAFKVAWKVKEKHPDCAITIHVEHCTEGLNPKVSNLMPAYRIAKHTHILISDSNVMVGPDYLKAIVRPFLDPTVGLVSNIIRGKGGVSLGAVLENLHLNSFVLGGVCFLDRFLHRPCVVGKSMLMRRDDLDAIGGFDAVKDVLAEDYVIGKKMHENGRKVVLSGYLIDNVNEYWGVKKFLNRHTRWGKLRRHLGGPAYISELLGNPVFMAFLPLVLGESFRMSLGLAVGVSIAKLFADMRVSRIIGSDLGPKAFLLSPAKDLLIGLLWFVPLVSSNVTWRGNRYRIGKDSALSPCPERAWPARSARLITSIRARFAQQLAAGQSNNL